MYGNGKGPGSLATIYFGGEGGGEGADYVDDSPPSEEELTAAAGLRKAMNGSSDEALVTALRTVKLCFDQD